MASDPGEGQTRPPQHTEEQAQGTQQEDLGAGQAVGADLSTREATVVTEQKKEDPPVENNSTREATVVTEQKKEDPPVENNSPVREQAATGASIEGVIVGIENVEDRVGSPVVGKQADALGRGESKAVRRESGLSSRKGSHSSLWSINSSTDLAWLAKRLHDEIDRMNRQLEDTRQDKENCREKKETLEHELEDLKTMLAKESAELFEQAEARREAAERAFETAEQRRKETQEAMEQLRLQVKELHRILKALPRPKDQPANIKAQWASFKNSFKKDSQLDTPTLSPGGSFEFLVFRPQGPAAAGWPEFLHAVQARQPMQSILSTPFMRMCIEEDVGPCLASYGLEADRLLRLMADNHLLIKPAPLTEMRETTCGLANQKMLCTFLFKESADDPTWKPLGTPSYERIVVVAEFITYVRHMSMGILQASLEDQYTELLRLRMRMAAARLGLYRLMDPPSG